VVDPLDLVAVDQRQHLAREIGLDVVPVTRELDLEAAAALEHAADDAF
jgi:hypothetical protein